MSESPLKYTTRGDDAYDSLGVLDHSQRPWQTLVSGTGEMPSGKMMLAFDRILDLFPDVGSLVVETAKGSVMVQRDFNRDYTKEVDQLLAGVFRNHPNVTGVTLRWSAERQHTATPEAPYGSPHGAEYARINAAQARGELTPAEAIEALKKIHRPAGE
jgi:hypothetical protein